MVFLTGDKKKRKRPFWESGVCGGKHELCALGSE